MKDSNLKALLVDDHPIVTEAITTALLALNIFSEATAVRSLAEATEFLESSPSVDLVMLDLHLEDTQGVEGMSTLREKYPDLPIVIFSGEEDPAIIAQSFEYGVRGFIPKSSNVDIIVNAIRMVMAGSSYIPPNAIRLLGFDLPPTTVKPTPPPMEKPTFTPRQEEVLHCLLKGMPNKVIADRLDMAEGTVKTHLATVFRVLGAKSRAQVILKARQLGMI
ncbi:DNA-binding response regulator [Hahella sp. CCB-MM4]|uniref:response regulator transcription factor n=1 Tax=Hahella sp. (strain CCB-MM4) TaxID=1926491 RepID=UPI000B9BF434|nr:response regulator transcription factor [Hahella sp. CCB-MM4]OZG70129.1 DNA-binding response regulator [Hahella sp. CCB-MM4]